MLGQATVRGEEKRLCGGTRQNNDWLNMGRCGGSGDGVKNGKRPRSNLGSISGSGRFPGEGNGNPLQCSCLENPMDGGVWWAIVQRVAKSWTRLSN